MRAVIYARVSSMIQRDRETITSQLRALVQLGDDDHRGRLSIKRRRV